MRVYETHNCFMIERGNQTACMGDGTEQTFTYRGKEVKVGEPNFVRAWQSDVNKNRSTYREAYFPHQ